MAPQARGPQKALAAGASLDEPSPALSSRRPTLHRFRAPLAAALWLWASAALARPEAPDQALVAAPAEALTGAAPPAPAQSRWVQGAIFLGGAASGLLLHESGHVAAGAALGGWPHLQLVHFLGVIPFFAVAPGIDCDAQGCYRFGAPFSPGRAGAYLIFSAGFHVQHLTDELILSLEPGLSQADAPFRKGLLAFNTLLSAAYVAANLLGIEPRAGDVGSIARISNRPRLVVDGLLLGVAALDLARYQWPETSWLAWASRAAKLATLGLVLPF